MLQYRAFFQRMSSLLLVGVGLTGCALFFGGGDSAERKSDSYSITPPASKSWQEMLDNERATSDRAFLATSTGAIISINSLCKKYQDASLEVLMKNLLLGFETPETLHSEKTTMDGRDALRHMFQTRMDGVPVKVEAVVMRKNFCIYDFIHIAKPDIFDRTQSDFSAFLTSFHAD